MKNIILLGKPCSGKGTLSTYLKSLNYNHISGSDLLREHIIDDKSLYYKEAKYALDNGKMITDEIINGIFIEKMKSIDNGLPNVFDGFPRSLSQFDTLLSLFDDSNVTVVLLDADDDVCLSRSQSRLTCTACAASFSTKGKEKPKNIDKCDHCNSDLYIRKDDLNNSIESKIKEYNEKTLPIVKHAKDKNIRFYKINIESDFDNFIKSL